jgi:ribonuclease P protein component
MTARVIELDPEPGGRRTMSSEPDPTTPAAEPGPSVTVPEPSVPAIDQRLRGRERLRASADFQRAFAQRCAASSGVLVVHAARNGLEHSRLGLSVGKKRIRRAFARNRFKRIVREAFRLEKARLPRGFDLVVVPRGETPSLAQARVELVSLAEAAVRRLERRAASERP